MSQRRLRILLVDDEPDILLLLQAMLSAETWEVVGKATNGEAALRIAEQIEPDVAVLDYMMPGMHGVEVARALKQLRPHCKVVLFTAFELDDQPPEIDRFLSKTNVHLLEDLLEEMAGSTDAPG
ncbi:MAG: two-component system, NarL family, response regulator LiaR [Actinomycetota bacterium]|nr:two-component system, NarL family, response regulator LiaR [Actinomycetota bacterium]